jgi:hypothetical protein
VKGRRDAGKQESMCRSGMVPECRSMCRDDAVPERAVWDKGSAEKAQV